MCISLGRTLSVLAHDIRTCDGDLFEIDVLIFGWPLRNPLKVSVTISSSR
jgi:hypothetical protein